MYMNYLLIVKLVQEQIVRNEMIAISNKLMCINCSQLNVDGKDIHTPFLIRTNHRRQ